MLMRVCALMSLLLLGLNAQAATEIFMKVDGIPGESTDARHPNEIVLTGYTIDFSRLAPTTGGGGGAGRVTISPMSVTKAPDVSSPRLALASASGQHIRQVDIYVVRTGREPFEFLHFILTDVVVAGFSQGQTTGGAQPMEQVALTFATIEMIYTPQRADGSAGTPVRMKWDVQRNAAG